MQQRSPAPRALGLPLLAATILGLAAAMAPPVQAQPFGAWGSWSGSHAFVGVNHTPALNPTGAFTFEAWVRITNSTVSEDCRSIAGKNWQEAWWVGACTNTAAAGDPQRLRSYLKGGTSARNGGIIPRNVWTHIAVVFNGTQRLHYINGELVASFAESGPLTTSPGEQFRIGSDEAWQFSPTGDIDEVRLWNVARTLSQLRANLNRRINSAQPGLVAVWALDGTTDDVVGPHDGFVSGTILAETFPALANCAGLADGNTLCLQNRFAVEAFWRTSPAGEPTDGQANVGVFNSGSGIFWFFAASNWEVMIKAINGCGLNNRYWVFSAATTNVFYRVEVFDVTRGAQKIYFNYPGPPAPAVTDTDAFATCP